MVEEIPNPTIEGPKIMVYCIATGTVTGFVFLTCLLFVAGSVENVIESTAGSLLQIIYDATQSRPGAVWLMIFPLVCLVLCFNCSHDDLFSYDLR